MISALDKGEAFLSEWGLVLAATIVICTLAWYWATPRKVPGEGKMTTREDYDKIRVTSREHKRKLNSRLADKIGDVLLDMLVSGELTDEEYRTWNFRLSKHFKDLAPRKLTPTQLKVALKRRVGNGVNKPVPLPKVKEVYKPKNIVDKILHPHFT